MPCAKHGAADIGNLLSIARYREAGGATGAIARTADTVFEEFTDSTSRPLPDASSCG